MSLETGLSLFALVTLVPALTVGWKRAEPRADALYWGTLGLAMAGPCLWVVGTIGNESWSTSFSTALWVTVATSLVLFAGLAKIIDKAWRLSPLLVAYLFGMSLLALIWSHAPAAHPLQGGSAGWLPIHILASVVTYGLLTLAAVAALAAFLQERALKAKRPTRLTRSLPSVADCETLLVRLLIAGEVVLLVGLCTGMATEYMETGRLLAFDHKTLLSFLAFAVIGGLLAAHFLTGVRGRMATRLVLLGYLLLTFGYPGVKFVTDVLMG